jgi:hypothetical protein
MIILFCSCSDEILELKGKVLDDKSKIAVTGRKIIVNALIPVNDNTEYYYVGECCTDSSGYFTFPLKKIKSSYLFQFQIVGDSLYSGSNTTLGLTDLYRYGKFLSFQISRLTNLTIAIEKKNKSTFPETLYVSWISDGINGKELYPYTVKNYGIRDHGNTLDQPLKWVGRDVKSAVKTRVYADKATIVKWKIFRDREVQEFADTIFCKKDAFNYVHFSY